LLFLPRSKFLNGCAYLIFQLSIDLVIVTSRRTVCDRFREAPVVGYE
jgi:hypothetical protein